MGTSAFYIKDVEWRGRREILENAIAFPSRGKAPGRPRKARAWTLNQQESLSLYFFNL